MISSSNSSNISIAEEATESTVYSLNDKSFMNTDISNSQSTSNVSDVEIEVQKPKEQSLYSQIKPEHIQIRNLHVDPSIKPDYLNSNASSGGMWNIMQDVKVKKRKNSIMKFLFQAPEEGSDKLMNEVDEDLDLISVDNNAYESENNESSRENIKVLESFSPDNLEHQINLKNERYHFLLADLMISRLQLLACETMEEVAKRKKKQKQQNVEIMMAEQISSDSLEVLEEEKITRSSRADVIALHLQNSARKFSYDVCGSTVWQRCIAVSTGDLLALRKSTMMTKKNDTVQPQKTKESKDVVVPVNSNNGNDRCVDDSSGVNVLRDVLQSSYSFFRPIALSVGGKPIVELNDNSECQLQLPRYVATEAPSPSQANAVYKKYRQCPGCLSFLPPDSANKLRFCRYYGLLFCSSCHGNTLMRVPARILQQWDFSMLPVSAPARDLLRLIHHQPLFLPTHFSKHLQRTLKPLSIVCKLRIQAHHLLVFIKACRQAGTPLIKIMNRLPPHWTTMLNLSEDWKNNKQNDKVVVPLPNLFSMADLLLLDTGDMERLLRKFVVAAVEHVSLCPLCQARGFICQACSNGSVLAEGNSGKKTNKSKTADDILFPFEVDRVVQCSECRACVHSSCYKRLVSASTAAAAAAAAASADKIIPSTEWCLRCRRVTERQSLAVVKTHESSSDHITI